MDISGEVYQIASRFLKRVKKSGSDDVMAICPFHMKADGSEEGSPSFALSLSKGLFFCHSCHAKGNLLSFFRDLGVPRDKIETHYRFLIDAAAKNMPPPPDPLHCGVWELPPIEEGILGLFDYCPTDLLNEGYTNNTLYHFEVGYDRWHRRITYPLRDIKGSLVGISGRATLKDQNPRYKVYTREYGLWKLPPRGKPDKRSLLWNAHRVYPEVYLSNPGQSKVVVVEGFKAAMWLWQCGISNVVALLGSYLSWEQRWMLERLGSTVYLFLDNDYAGRSGTIKAADTLAKSLNVHVIEYPERLIYEEKSQPDDCTPDEALNQMAISPTYLNWLMKHG